MNSQDILNNTAYADILFTETEKTAINNAIVIKKSRGIMFRIFNAKSARKK